MADPDVNLPMGYEKVNDYGVLLYYKYTSIADLQNLFDFYHSNCTSLSLLGRVRLAPHGVNVTVGGRLRALEEHIEAVKSKALFEGTDFKLASCLEPLNDQVAKECGFTSLSIRIVKELVTLGSHPLMKSPEISNAGRHLSAAEFHSILRNAGKCQEKSSSSDKKLILLDARNLYETRIGKFEAPDVKTLDPEIRQYSDLPAWIDNNSEKLRGNHILMYCTGGIRCEMASAYIRSKGAGFENVFQLYGGIQRYMEQFLDGGFFKGKNFVFDHRVACIMMLNGEKTIYSFTIFLEIWTVCFSCAHYKLSLFRFHQLESWFTCPLFSGTCKNSWVTVGSLDANILGTCLLCGAPFDDYTSRCRCIRCRMLVLICHSCRKKNLSYVCELCQKIGKPVASISSMDSLSEELLRPVSHDHSSNIGQATQSPLSSNKGHDTALTKRNRKLRILCLHGFRQNASSFKGRTSSLAKKLKNIAEFFFVDAPHELPFIYLSPPSDQNHSSGSAFTQQSNPLDNHCHRKCAWLVSTDYAAKYSTEWKMAKIPFSSLQHQQQTEGFDRSIDYLKTIFSRAGPFDGIMGFSQGAAMAALVGAHKEMFKGEMDFRFVILCSGFAVNMEECVEGSINCPSLHVFGNKEGKDRQIDCEASKHVASLFENGSSVIIEHNLGHIIPTRSPYIDEIKYFLGRFL